MTVYAQTPRWLERYNTLTYIPQTLYYLADEAACAYVESNAFTVFIGTKRIVLPKEPIATKWPSFCQRSLTQKEIELTHLTLRQLQCLVAIVDGVSHLPKGAPRDQIEQMQEARRLVCDWFVESRRKQLLNSLLEYALAHTEYREVGKLLSLGASMMPVRAVVKETVQRPYNAVAFNQLVSAFVEAKRHPDLQEAFDNPNVSDHVVVCDGEAKLINLQVLSFYSDFFQGIANTAMREKTVGRTEIVNLPRLEVWEVLMAMYTGCFRVPKIDERKSDCDNATDLLLQGVHRRRDYLVCLDFFIVRPYKATLAFMNASPTFRLVELLEEQTAPSEIASYMKKQEIGLSKLLPVFRYALKTPESHVLFSSCLEVVAAFSQEPFLKQEWLNEHEVLASAYNNPNVSDCVFRFTGQQLQVNRTLLSLPCLYFKDLLQRRPEAEIDFGIATDEKLLLQYLYGESVAISDTTYDFFLTLAKTHGMPFLREACEQWFIEYKAPKLRRDYRAFYHEVEKLACTELQEVICTELFDENVASDGGANFIEWYKGHHQPTNWLQALKKMVKGENLKADIFSFLCQHGQFVTEMILLKEIVCDFALLFSCFPGVKELQLVQAKASCVQHITAILELCSLQLRSCQLQDYLRFRLLASLTHLTLEECSYYCLPTATWGQQVPFELLRSLATLPLLRSLSITCADALFTFHIMGFTNLKRLEYRRTDPESAISTHEIRHLASLSSIQELTLSACEYGDLTPLLACGKSNAPISLSPAKQYNK